MDVALALAYAHQEGILHRDIKPANLLLDTRGTVWLTDFGLAKAEGSDELTRTGDIVGTVRYMAPERFSGPADARSDVYGLGITLYELLTLQPAFHDSQRMGLLRKIMHEEPLPPRKRDPHIPRDLETIILKAIAKERADRYRSAAGLAEDLSRFLADRPVQARRTSIVERLWRWRRRNPRVAWLSAAVALLLVLIAAGSVIASVLLERERNRVVRELVWSQLAQIRASRQSGQPGRRFTSLQTLDEVLRRCPTASWPDSLPSRFELRNEMIACLALADLYVPADQTMPSSGPGPTFVAFEPQLEIYARSSLHEDVSLRRWVDDTEIARIPDSRGVSWLYWSPNGRFLAVTDLATVRVWDVAKGTWLPSAFERPWGHSPLDFSPDSRRLVVAGPTGGLRCLDLETGNEVPGWEGGPAILALRFHPRRPQLAVSRTGATTVQVCTLATGEILRELPHPWEEIDRLAWRDDGTMLAAGCSSGRVCLWDLLAGRPLKLLEGHGSLVAHVAFNHAGDRLATGGWDPTVRLWDTTTGKELFRTTSPLAGHLGFGPDDNTLACTVQNNQLGLWRFAAGREYRTFSTGHAWERDSDGAVSPDERLLAMATDSGFGLWDLATGRELARVPLGNVQSVAFHPRGNELWTSGAAGLHCWPIRPDPAKKGVLRLGPPETLPLAIRPGRFAISRDGRRLALANYEGPSMVMDLGPRPWRPRVLGSHMGNAFTAVSPDGRWVANGTWNATDVKVWDADTGNEVQNLPVPGGATVCFSPDNRWLAVTTVNECRLWHVDSWQPGCSIALKGKGVPGHVAFSGDGKLFAAELSPSVLSLLDPDTGSEYARLTSPNHVITGRLYFTPANDRLVVHGQSGEGVRIWDLRRIREQLLARRLDWELPPYQSPRQPPPIEPPQVEVVLSNRATDPNPEDAAANNLAAWFLVIDPDPRPGDAERAVVLGKKAVGLAPTVASYRNTLGVALYRAGECRDAVAELTESTRLRHGGDAFDWFFLAMAHWRLGNKEEAWQWFHRAILWSQKQRPGDEDLLRIRKEAETLLGLHNPGTMPDRGQPGNAGTPHGR
jgi:WD40 repeat protein